jgi:hypothetical protein
MVSNRLAWPLSLLITALPILGRADTAPPCLACDREMRKTFEAIQAWRRLHDGRFPGRLADLKTAGLLPVDCAICPDVLRERHGASAARSGVSSSADAADPPGTYEYELSGKVRKSQSDRMFLPDDAPPYTRQDVKTALLRRPFFEQVPILRCSSHREAAPAQFTAKDEGWRNLTVEGKVYWSGRYWEQLWLDDVPYCARDANVLFGLKGPPFHTDRAPTLAGALDLRKWSCAFGDHVWWWTYPMFEQEPNRQVAAHLRPFFQEDHGRVLKLNDTEWWLDGLVQLQGRISSDQQSLYTAPGRLTCAWKKTGAEVGRAFRRASWLQGTVWTAAAGETVGWLVWHYADGATERAPIIYGRNTARFWAEPRQIENEKDFVEPVWRFHETKEAVGKERWLRIYRQEWVNPRPEVVVASLDFVSNQDCPAAPFLIAVNVVP